MEMLILASIMMFGGAFAFDVFGHSGDDSADPPDDGNIHGTAADDSLSHDHGVIWGEAGDDSLAASGSAVARGGEGNDSITATGTGEAQGGCGDDTICGSDEAHVFSGDGDDVVTANGYVLAHGGAGDDQMLGTGPVTLYGQDGDDKITIGGEFSVGFGGAGNDTLTNNGHFDQLFGGDGNDYVQTSDGYRVRGDAGDDTLFGAAHLYGGDGADSITGTTNLGGGDGNDIISARGSDDAGYALAYGDAGDDTLFGHDSASSTSDFYGDDGNDLLVVYGLTSHSHGDAGDDTVISLAGSQGHADASVSLGSGHDLLAVQALSTGDGVHEVLPVTDFNPAEDQLAVILPPEDAADLTISVTTDPSGSFTEVHLRAAGDAGFDMTITLAGVSSFAAANIAFFADQAAVIAGTPYVPAVA